MPPYDGHKNAILWVILRITLDVNRKCIKSSVLVNMSVLKSIVIANSLIELTVMSSWTALKGLTVERLLSKALHVYTSTDQWYDSSVVMTTANCKAYWVGAKLRHWRFVTTVCTSRYVNKKIYDEYKELHIVKLTEIKSTNYLTNFPYFRRLFESQFKGK